MELNRKQLIERLRIFTQKNLEWCANESEQSTAQVTAAIDLLLKNTARVSSLSAESLLAIQGMQKAINLHFNNEKSRTSLDQLTRSLQVLANEHNEIQGVIQPIIQSLQFQDRLRQNLENMVKMLPIWVETREKMPQEVSQEQVLEFGRALMKVTTMITERDIVRNHIEGLEPEKQIDQVIMF